MSLHELFAARSIAVIGASDDPERIGGRPLRFLRESWLGHDDRMLYPVNPTRRTVQDMPAFPSVSAIGKPVDLAIVSVPAAHIEAAIADCATSGCRNAIVFSSGFAELGEAGRQAQQRLHDLARPHGMRLIGPNCLGVFDVPGGLYATFSEGARNRDFIAGGISVASQSGAVASQLLVMSRRLGVGMNKLISTGNEQDMDVAECISFLAADETTRVIIAYVEGMRDPARLAASLAAARARGKPVVAIKVGRSHAGARATRAHTGSDAGDDAAFEALLRQGGAVRVHGFEEAIDTAMLCDVAGPARGRRLGIMSVSGGAGAMIADIAEGAGLDIAPIPESPAVETLRQAVTFATVQNPLDITAQAVNDLTLWRKNLEAMLEGRGYDALIAFLTFVGESPKMFEPALASMAEVRQRYPDVPIIFCSLCTPEARLRAAASGFLVFEEANRAVQAVANWARLGAG